MEDTIQIGEMLREQVIREVREPDSLSEMEQGLRRMLLWVGRVVLELWLVWLEKPYAESTIECECGGEAKYLYRRKGTLRTMFGQVRYRRAYYSCQQCKRGTYPLDEQLGLRPNGMSAEVERLAGMVGVKEYGASEIFLEVRKTNEAAISVYEHLGFEIKRVLKGYYRDGEDAYLMALKFPIDSEENSDES